MQKPAIARVASERELQLPEQPQVSYVVDESSRLTLNFGSNVYRVHEWQALGDGPNLVWL